MNFTTSVQLSGRNCIINVPRNSSAWQKATSVFCPLGKAPTQAWVLMLRSDATALDVDAAQTLVWKQYTEGVLSKTLTFEGLFIVKAERLLHGGPDDANALYLVELADARWKCSTTHETGSIRANVRSYANDADYLTETEGYTWATLAEELWDACGLLGAFPGLPYVPDGVPENHFFIGLGAWRTLCAFLDQLDCAVDHDPLSNTYTIVQLGTPQTIPENADSLKWDSQPITPIASTAAATLRIYYYFHRKSYGQERDTELGENWAWNGAGDYKEVATGVPNAAGTKALWDDLPWILDEDNVHSNLAAVEARRDARKDRYVLRVGVADQHRIHIGLHDNIVTGAQCRAVLWRNWDDGNDNELGGTVTEFVCRSDLIVGMRSSDGQAWFDPELGAPEQENYLAPDLGRHTYPTYPRLPNIVQLRNAGASAGDEVSPNADGFHRGRVARWVANTLVGLDDCFIRFVDDHDNLDGQVNGIVDDYYGPARLSGLSTSDGSTLPVYIVRRGNLASNRVVRFKLTATLNTGTNAAAVIKEFNGTTYPDGTAITVFDSYGITNFAPGGVRGMFKGVSGMEGYAVQRLFPSQEGELEFEILWMEQWAWHAEVELLSDLEVVNGINSGIAQVTAYYEQGVPFQDSTIFVYDALNLFPRAKTGAKGHVRRDEYRETQGDAEGYYLIMCQQVALTGRAVLAEAMCQEGEFSISNFAVTSFSPFNQNIEPDAAFNDFGHHGAPDDILWLQWDDTQQAYVITDVTKKEQMLITKLEFSNDCIKYKQRLCAVESCEEESDLLELLCFKRCPPNEPA